MEEEYAVCATPGMECLIRKWHWQHRAMYIVLRLPERIEIDKLAMYARRFGLRTKEQIFYYLKSQGLFLIKHGKRLVKGEKWWKGETLSVSVGQGYLLVTPLQIARMVAAVCSGHLVRPRILEQEAVECEPIEISQRH